LGKDAAFEVFAKRLADVGFWYVVVTLAIELAGAGETWWFNAGPDFGKFYARN